MAITTNRASVTVPNPVVGGFAFPAGADYSWYVFGHGTPDADAALAQSLLDYYSVILTIGSGGPGLEQSGSFSVGTSRGFTFAP